MDRVNVSDTERVVGGSRRNDMSRSEKMPERPRVYATWYDDDAVWVVNNGDVPGLVTEADSLDSLVEQLDELVPEMLRINGMANSDGIKEIEIVLQAELTRRIKLPN